MTPYYQPTVRAIVREVKDGKKQGRWLWTAEDLARVVLPATRDVRQIREHLSTAKKALHDPEIVGLTILAKPFRKQLAAGQDADSNQQAKTWIAGTLAGNTRDRLMWALFNVNGLPQDGPLATAERERRGRMHRGVLEWNIEQIVHALGKGLPPATARTEIRRFAVRPFADPETVRMVLEQLGRGELGKGG